MSNTEDEVIKIYPIMHARIKKAKLSAYLSPHKQYPKSTDGLFLRYH